MYINLLFSHNITELIILKIIAYNSAMKVRISNTIAGKIILPFIFIILCSQNLVAQKIQFSLWADPLISWYSSDTRETQNDGIRPGFTFGLEFNRYFDENYAFSTGIFLLNSGGNLQYSDSIDIRFRNFTSTVEPGEIVTYRTRHISIPVGLKLKTNQIGYMTYFTNIGLDARILVGGKGDVPSLGIEGENITNELNWFNLGFHINVGMEYSLGGSTALGLGLGYENNFLDTTTDYNDQPVDRIRQSLIRFRIGVIF